MTGTGPRGYSFGYLINAYALIRRTGILDTRLGQALFTFAYFSYKRHLEDPYARLVRSRPELFRGGHILDVGANIGYTATVFSRALSEGFRVYAFEPEEFNFQLLERSARARKAKGRIVPVHAAVGDADGTITLRLNPGHHGDHQVARNNADTPAVDPALERTVPLLQLDTFAGKNGVTSPVSFIKIDVQGYETAVCHGMRGILSANPGVTVSLEYMPEALSAFGFDPGDLLDEFDSLGYSTALLKNDGKLVPAGRSVIQEAVKHSQYLNLLFYRTGK